MLKSYNISKHNYNTNVKNLIKRSKYPGHSQCWLLIFLRHQVIKLSTVCLKKTQIISGHIS